jgi:CRISPR-associated endoribonuclease Cas6
MSGEYLPVDYRRGFVSLIKAALEKSNPRLFEYYYSEHRLKPFTFSVYFPALQKSGKVGKLHVGKKVKFNFSTSSQELATYTYNGIIKNRHYPLFENEISFRSAYLLPPKIIKSQEVIFKTISPVLINNKGASDRYLLPDEEGFRDGLNFAVEEICGNFLNGQTVTKIDFEPLKIKRKVIWHYGQHRSGFIGLFCIRGERELLQLIYDIGLGMRRNQGFGMLEVVR